ncbi:GNAT family N-acetyltransferase [Parasphingorhabdus cellanae]|uniref:GNAT family N-acetyltransferase n=1 Tax=Parasphingorhabdus cellanae TaxID=2806553 RepID=A0ABX7T370_9SPHN|nr:GNAT family N-acetyltransferase [Parasphingorhabdus cellanae]QTD56016.1 GNAT family N-acetyltransferase [Parasphingorhabdus cellanae]
MTFSVLLTERLRLRPLRLEDADALHPVFADADLMRWWSSGPHKSVSETREYVAQNCEGEPWQTWAITRMQDDTALGWVVFIHSKDRPNVREIGYILNRSAWGAGIAREAVSRVIRYGFEELGLRRIYADVDPENMSSIKLLKVLGFQQEAHLRQESKTHIGIRDSLIFGLLQDD